MSMLVAGGAGAKSEINVTPLIDVLLVLLIIFMVIEPQVPVGLEALVPLQPRRDAQPDSVRTVVISINRDSSILINHDRTNWEDLKARLEEIFKTRAERVVFVRGDRELEFQPVARVIEAAHAAGIDRVALDTAQAEAR